TGRPRPFARHQQHADHAGRRRYPDSGPDRDVAGPARRGPRPHGRRHCGRQLTQPTEPIMIRSIRFSPAFLGAATITLVASIGSAHAAGAADAAVRKAITAMAPNAKIDAVEPAPLPGFHQVLLGGQLVYVSNDGQYVLQGSLYDVDARRDLTGARLA